MEGKDVSQGKTSQRPCPRPDPQARGGLTPRPPPTCLLHLRPHPFPYNADLAFSLVLPQESPCWSSVLLLVAPSCIPKSQVRLTGTMLIDSQRACVASLCGGVLEGPSRSGFIGLAPGIPRLRFPSQTNPASLWGRLSHERHSSVPPRPRAVSPSGLRGKQPSPLRMHEGEPGGASPPGEGRAGAH